MKNPYHTQGFTLIELMVYLGILSIISVVLSLSFISLTRGRAQNESRTEVQSNARFAMDKITQDIQAASSVSLGSGGVSTSSALVLTEPIGTVQYSVSNGQLQRTVNSGAPDIITSTLVTANTLTFTRADNYNTVLNATTTSVQTQLKLQYVNTSGEAGYSVTMQDTTNINSR